MSRKPYPSDLTDDQWSVLEPLVPPARPGGRPRKHDMRAVLDALFYHAPGVYVAGATARVPAVAHGLQLFPGLDR